MTTDSLDLGDFPCRTVRTDQKTDIGGLSTALGEKHGIMKEDLYEWTRRCRGRARLVLLCTLGLRRSLCETRADHGGGQFSEQWIACMLILVYDTPITCYIDITHVDMPVNLLE